jgi:hypothetical protein
VEEKKLVHFANVAKNVANMYRTSVINKALLSSKLNSLRVDIEISFAEAAAGFFIDCTDPTQRGAKYNVTIYADPKDDEMTVAFIFAHELAHLFFANNLDNLKITGRAKDQSFVLTSFRRMNGSGIIWGGSFEEYAADYLARYIVNKMYKGRRKSRAYTAFLAEKKFRFEVIEAYAALFGTSLNNCQYIDEYHMTEVDEGGYEVDIKNKFWYSIPTMATEEVEHEFNEMMENDQAYEQFCNMVEDYEQRPDSAKQEKIKQFLKKEQFVRA